GVMLNHLKSVVYGFSLFPRLFSSVLVGKLASLGAFSDTYSLALNIQGVASVNFRVSERLGRLAQLAI
ncbi:hypothetical protein, partial [Vibrio parahaemolyticus]|uniref:hypothetical protein n=1 Tax=Vibrio parahaemolyticus TaxID=670 RepID=UPI00236060C8